MCLTDQRLPRWLPPPAEGSRWCYKWWCHTPAVAWEGLPERWPEKEDWRSFVQEADKVTSVFRDRMTISKLGLLHWRVPQKKKNCRRRFLFKMKFWLSSVCGFQITKKFMKIAGNRWLKKLHNDPRYYFGMLFTPQFRREELEHTGRKCGRHLKLTQTLWKIIGAIAYHESLRCADEWFMWIVSEFSRWN